MGPNVGEQRWAYPYPARSEANVGGGGQTNRNVGIQFELGKVRQAKTFAPTVRLSNSVHRTVERGP